MHSKGQRILCNYLLMGVSGHCGMTNSKQPISSKMVERMLFGLGRFSVTCYFSVINTNVTPYSRLQGDCWITGLTGPGLNIDSRQGLNIDPAKDPQIGAENW